MTITLSAKLFIDAIDALGKVVMGIEASVIIQEERDKYFTTIDETDLLLDNM